MSKVRNLTNLFHIYKDCLRNKKKVSSCCVLFKTSKIFCMLYFQNIFMKNCKKKNIPAAQLPEHSCELTKFFCLTKFHSFGWKIQEILNLNSGSFGDLRKKDIHKFRF